MNVPGNLLGRIVRSGFVLGSHGPAIKAGGHGIAPIGLMAASVIHSKAFRLIAPPAMLCPSTSMIVFVGSSDAWIITTGTALPFVGAVAVTGACLWRWPRSCTKPAQSLDDSRDSNR